MNLLLVLQIGLSEIAAHKFRSFLSMLGIVLGVASLIATMALTAGIEQGARTFMQQMGGLEFVNVVNKEISGRMFDFWNLSPGRTMRDVHALQQGAPLVSHVSPELSFGASIGSGGKTDRKQVQGVTPDHFVVAKHEPGEGRFLVDLDIERAARVAVIGRSIAELLWPGVDAKDVVGRLILIDGRPFHVVGVLPIYEREEDKLRRKRNPGGQRFAGSSGRRWDPFRGKNEAVLIPISTAFYELRSGQFPLDSLDTVRLNTLNVRVADLSRFGEALNQVRSVLDRTHRGVDDYDLETREEWFDRMETSVRATRLSGGMLAIISLVVGGIGIMNIMLASISERVREIGIRLAVGARGRDIFIQIITESVSISAIGGVLGIGAAVGLVELIKVIAPSDNTPIITVGGVLFSLTFALLAGFASGIYPALRASRLNPISALRYE